jgi:hypothetical protein
MSFSIRYLGKIKSKARIAVKLGRPSNLTIILRDLFKLHYRSYSDKIHLDAAMEWLCRSQDVMGCEGCSAVYGFIDGWSPPYPETTGYIIPTFLQYASLTGNSDYLERAKKMGDWEIQIQLPSGAVRGRIGVNEFPIVFNTGMVILGWLALYGRIRTDRFLKAAARAGEWLLSIQDSDGKWSKYTHNNLTHAYHSRVAWAVLELYRHTNSKRYKDAAEKNVLWVLSLAKENGWFNKMSLEPDQQPLTHTIAYTLRGLIESSLFLEEGIRRDILNTVIEASKNILRSYDLRKKASNSRPLFLAATLDEEWNASSSFSCLAGDAQIAIIWLKIYSITHDARFLEAAVEIIEHLKMVQNLNSKNLGIRGGISGSYPIWRKYMGYSYPNWATKFFADALMLKDSVCQNTQLKKK